MSADVEELFEGGRAARPRFALALAILGIGVVTTLLGMACTAVPGGLITLAGYFVVQKEIDRVDSGYLAVEHRPALLRLRLLAWFCLGTVIALFIVQGVLLCSGVYTALWAGALESLRPFVEAPAP